MFFGSGRNGKRKGTFILFVAVIMIYLFFYHATNSTVSALVGKTNVQLADYREKERRENQFLYEAFKKSGAQFKQLQVNGWTKIHKDFRNEQETGEYFSKCLKKIPFIDEIDITEGTNQADAASVLFQAQGKIDDNISLRLTMMNGEHDYYMILSMAGQETVYNKKLTTHEAASLLDSFPNTEDYASILKKTSMVIMGTMNGKLDSKTIFRIAEDSMGFLKSNKVETLANDHVVSVSGYTPMLSKWLTVDGKSVNINMAFRYNAIEKLTRVYYATPIITSEY